MSSRVLKTENVDYGTNLTEINDHAHIYHKVKILGYIFLLLSSSVPHERAQ